MIAGPIYEGPLRPGLVRLAFALLVVVAISWMCPATAGASLQATPAHVQLTVWDGVYTEGQAERGAVQYTEACAACHTPDLSGDGTSSGRVLPFFGVGPRWVSCSDESNN